MKCDKNNLLLYAVTDRYWLNGRSLCSVVKESLDGGVTFVQLREKKLDEAHFLEEAKELQQLCRSYHVPFVINDNVIAIGGITKENVGKLSGSGICGIAVISAIYAQKDIQKAAADLKTATNAMLA